MSLTNMKSKSTTQASLVVVVASTSAGSEDMVLTALTKTGSVVSPQSCCFLHCVAFPFACFLNSLVVKGSRVVQPKCWQRSVQSQNTLNTSNGVALTMPTDSCSKRPQKLGRVLHLMCICKQCCDSL